MGVLCESHVKESEVDLVYHECHSNYEEEFLNVIKTITYTNEDVKKHLEGLEPFRYEKRKEPFKQGKCLLAHNDIKIPNEHYYGFVDSSSRGRTYKGVIVYDDGTVYEGHFENDLPSGYGRKVFSTLEVYCGEYKNGRANGKGEFHHSGEGCYEGDWKDDKQNGYGTEQWGDGEKYEGYYKDGLKDGEGIYMWGDGSIYEGNFVKGLQEGKGTYTSANGEKYSGSWVNGVESGYGVKEYVDGTVYKGKFKDGKRHGKGTLITPEGEWQGIWSEDKEIGLFKLIVNGEVVKTINKGMSENSSVYVNEDVPGENFQIQKLRAGHSIIPVLNNDIE